MFDPQDPFPLLTEGQVSYAQEKDHATLVDLWLQFQILEIEQRLKHQYPQDQRAETWIGLPPETLQTPYIEIRRILGLLNLRPGMVVSDLGCAYGRMAHVINRHFPGVSFIGLECESLRLREAARVAKHQRLKACQWLQMDFSDVEVHLTPSDIFFIYDSSTTQSLRELLKKIRLLLKIQRNFKVVGRGRRIRDLIEREEPWLSQVHKPQHFKNFSIYQS